MSPGLPYSLYRAADVRELDRQAIEVQGIPGETLMERAGAAAFALLRSRWPAARRIVVLCGLGNNGGDGYVVARLAQEAGLSVRLLSVGDPDKLKGDAHGAAGRARAAGLVCEPFDAELPAEADAAVDALFGTGLDRPVEGAYREAIEWVNAAAVPVLAIDIPSGLHADSGAVMGAAVRAAATITFIGVKQGLLTGDAPDCCGDLHFDDLKVPAAVHAAVRPAARRVDLEGLALLLPRRSRTAHKGHFGHVLVIGGDHGFAGAARMAAEAAARCGAGLISVATRAAHAPILAASRPELMCHAADSPESLAPVLARATTLAVGPGLGQGEWGRALLAHVLELDLPMVLDADALNLLAAEPVRKDSWVLTPHPGEAARLLGCPTSEVQADRYGAARELQGRYGGVVVLKGAGTVIAEAGGEPAVCGGGNPGMASGGMGDVLTGTVAGLLAQGLGPGDAARTGVCLHAAAADRAAEQGERGLLATDLMPWLRRLANP